MSRPRQVRALLVAISVAIAAAGWIARRVSAASERGSVDSLMLKLDLAQEDAVAVWFSTALLLAIAGLAATASPGAYPRRWRGLAAIALALSVEQVVHFHQVFVPLLSRHVGGAWIVAAGVALVGLLALYVPWLRALPPPSARAVGGGVGLLLLGAIGLELLGRALTGSVPPVAADALMSVEEGCELVGLSLVVYGLLLLREDASAAAGVPEPG